MLRRDELSEVEVIPDEVIPDEVVHDEVVAATTTPTSSAAATAELLRAAADPALTEDFALALLKRADLPAEVLE